MKYIIIGIMILAILAVIFVPFGSLFAISTNNRGDACWKSGASCWFQWDTLPTSKTIATGYGSGRAADNPYAGMNIDFANSLCDASVACLCSNPECGGPGVGGSAWSSCSVYDAGGGWVGVSIGGEATTPRTPPTACDFRIWTSAGSSASVSLNIIEISGPGPEPPVPTSPPPNPLQFLVDLWAGFISWLKSLFGLWAIAPSDSFMAGDTVSRDLSVTINAVADLDYSDGTVTYIYGRYAVAKDGSIIEEGNWEPLTTNTFVHSFSNAYTQPGTYAYTVVIYSMSSIYDVNTELWGPYTIQNQNTDYLFKVVSPGPPPNPLQFLIDLWNGFIGWLQSLFGI